jgi:sn-glycerol 3-phosphate transport system permease protein
MPNFVARSRSQSSNLAGYAVLVLLIVLIGAPLFWMVTGAVKTTQQIYALPPVWVPSHPRWSNFTDAWNAAPFGRFYVNSIILTVLGTAIKLVNAMCTAYALVFLRFPLKNLIFILILAGLMIPEQVTILPNYITLSDVFGMSWINTYQGIILPGAAIAFGTFLLRQSFLGLPHEVLDAAKVDGCGHVRLLWDMVIPMSKPVLATVTLIVAVQRWNDYLWPLVITTTQEMRPLTVGLTYLFDQEGNTDWGVVMAATIFVIVPLLVVFVLAQKLIIEGITAGATKG